MKKNKKLFSKVKTENHCVYCIFGIKISVKDKKRKYDETMASKFIQDTLDLSELQNSKKVIVFFTPTEAKINGGVISIFNLCKVSRELNRSSFCTISTYPNGNTYVINDKFPNNEKVLRFDQIVDNAKNVQELILHIPEYYADDFYKDLNENDIDFLKSVPNLHINIMNQNIELMPESKKLKDLYKLTDNITQTIAHNRYATQEICNKWQIPTHLFSTIIDMSMYKKYSFEEKEKIIVLSPDLNDYKNEIVSKLEKDFSDWKLIKVQNMSFRQYVNLISRAYFTITFGEGFDGYFNQPAKVGSIGISVYNDNFFPDKSWLEFSNVFKSYEDMKNNITDVLYHLYNNKDEYSKLSSLHKQKWDAMHDVEQYKDNLRRFYEKEYDFLPVKMCK